MIRKTSIISSTPPEPAKIAGGFPAHPPATIINTPTQPPRKVKR
jgi:hypothetical protein